MALYLLPIHTECLWLYDLKDCHMRRGTKFITKHAIKCILIIHSAKENMISACKGNLTENVHLLSVLQHGTDDLPCIMIHKGQINSDEHRVFTCITFARWHGLH